MATPSNWETIPHSSTLVDLLRWRATHQFDQSAYTFLSNGESQEAALNYGGLDRQARAIAALLQSITTRGERALLLYPPGLEFIAGFFGCLYAGVIAVPAYPPEAARLTRTWPRLQAIISDAKAKVVLTTKSIQSLAQPLFEQAPDLRSLEWLSSDNFTASLENDWQEPDIGSEDVAFLQYTSGSTGVPKGVMLMHSNLLHNARLVYHALDHSTEDKYVSWLPTFHDMGFMAGVLQPLFAGIPAVLLAPTAFLERPVRWLKAISDHQATISGGPNFAYDLCTRKITAKEREGLNLSNWSVAFNGAEPIRAETLDRFVAAFQSCGFRPQAFYPCYGLAEATLMVSGSQRYASPVVKRLQKKSLENNRIASASEQDKDSVSVIGCGRALLDQKIIIVDTDSSIECLPAQVGEIWIAGPSVAKGYWNRLDDTNHTFQARLSNVDEAYLRTGDLGFLDDGELYVTGRLKDLIIIRGLNHYPQDIEHTVERSHPALRPGCGAAFSVEVAGQERLVVVQEVDQRKEPDLETVIDAIRQAVAEHHELQAYTVALVRAGSVPKTSSGKVRRNTCRKELLEGGLEVIARSDLEENNSSNKEESFIRKALLAAEVGKRQVLMESYLQEQVGRTLKVAPGRLRNHRSLTALGLDSLMAVELKNQIEMELGISLPITELLEDSNLSNLATALLARLESPASSTSIPYASPAQTGGEYSLSYTQRALWFLHQLAPESSAYNIAFAARISSEVDTAALREAFQRLIDRHPALRTTFHNRDGQPFQKVHKQVDVSFDQIDAANLSDEELNEYLVERVHSPFDLEYGPIVRVVLFSLSSQKHILLLTLHHIAIDGWSFWILLDELRLLYPAARDGMRAALPTPSFQYIDYVGWQTEMLEGAEGERLWEYWKEELAGELPILNLHGSKPRPSVQSHRGATHGFKLSEETVRALKAMAQAEGATLYMVLLAAFQVLLHRYTDQEDILVGSPASARGRAEFEATVGCFFNAVILRANFSGDPTFQRFLSQVRQKVTGALEHQDYPSHLLAERLQATRDPSRPPLFQVTFILQQPHRFKEISALLLGEAGTQVDLGGLMLEIFPLEKRYARADLELEMIEAKGTMLAWLQYDTDLFDAATVARMAGHYQVLLAAIIEDPQQHISQLRLLTEAEHRRVVKEWSSSGADYSETLSISELFRQQAEKSPHKLAAVYDNSSLTFQELNDQAGKLARLIKELKHDSK